MKAFRWLVLLMSGLALGTAFAACGFPEVTFAPEDDGGLDGATSEPDTGPFDSADADADALAIDAGDGAVDANLLDVAVVEDAGGKIDAADCTSCDCDEDGYNRNEPDCGAGPFDCDDNDSRSHPNQSFLAERAESPMNGDWNCDDTLEKGYDENVNCEKLLLGLGCAGKFGFSSTVACGEKGRWARCKTVPVLIGLPLACAIDPDTLEPEKIQPCK